MKNSCTGLYRHTITEDGLKQQSSQRNHPAPNFHGDVDVSPLKCSTNRSQWGTRIHSACKQHIYSRRRVHAKNSRGVKFLWPPSIFSDCEVAFTLGGCGNVIHNDA